MRHCSPSLAEQLPCRRAGWHLHFPAGRVSTFLVLSGLSVLPWFLSCWGCIPVPSEVPLKPQCPSHPHECGLILLCPHGRGWQWLLGLEGLCRAVQPKSILVAPVVCLGGLTVSQPAGPVTSSVCPAAVLLFLSPWSHLLTTFPLSPLVIISPETPQPGSSSLLLLSFCIFREKALNVMCCSQTAALVTSPPVGPCPGHSSGVSCWDEHGEPGCHSWALPGKT